MSTPNSTLSQRVAVVAALDPQTIDDTNAVSDYASMAKFARAAFVVSVGNIDAATTVDAELLEATDAAGTGAQAIEGKAVTQLGATDDNKQTVIELAAGELSPGFTHVACRVTVAGDTADVSVLGLGIDARHEPASDNDIASVAQIVA